MFLKFLRLLLRMKMKWNQVSWSDPEESFQTDASMMALKANQIATESERSSVRDRQWEIVSQSQVGLKASVWSLVW